MLDVESYFDNIAYRMNINKPPVIIKVLIGIACIAIIVLISTPISIPFFSHRDTKKTLASHVEIRAFQNALEQYKADSGRYPESDAVNSSKPLIEALQGDPNSSPTKK
jgi:type II secretory pathway pseudopilin PulG